MKKNILLLTLATSTLLLSSCGKITVEFPNGDTPLTNTPISLDHNTLDVIYDSIKNSDNYESDINSIYQKQLLLKLNSILELQVLKRLLKMKLFPLFGAKQMPQVIKETIDFMKYFSLVIFMNNFTA